MTDQAIDMLISEGYDIPGEFPKSNDSKKQKLLECVHMGNSKQYLGKVYTEDQINKLSPQETEKLFAMYEAKLSGQMVKSLGKSIIHMYSMGACAMLGINNQDELSNDLGNDPFLNSVLQRFTCDLYYRYGFWIAPLSVGMITSKHYIQEKQGEDSENIIADLKNGVYTERRANSSYDQESKES